MKVVDDGVTAIAMTQLVPEIRLPTEFRQHPCEQSMDGAVVLIVDDSPAFRILLKRHMSGMNVVIHEAGDGVEALEVAALHTPDLIITDVVMPNMDGLSLIEALPSQPWYNDQPVIVVTSQTGAEFHTHALRAGASDLVVKPIVHSVLCTRASNLLERYRTRVKNAELLARLSQYLSGPAVDHANDIAHGMVERRLATAIFTDLRGFTHTSRLHDPMRVFDELSKVLNHQTEIVDAWGGYVDQFLGDGLLAVFPGVTGLEQACDTAIALTNWARNYSVEGIWDSLPLGIGVSCGNVMRGNLGGNARLQHTVFGQPVNIASRLCNIAAAHEVLVAPDVASFAPERFQFSAARDITLKGLPDLNKVHSLIVET